MSFVQHTINKHTRCFPEEVKFGCCAGQSSLLFHLMGRVCRSLRQLRALFPWRLGVAEKVGLNHAFRSRLFKLAPSMPAAVLCSSEDLTHPA